MPSSIEKAIEKHKQELDALLTKLKSLTKDTDEFKNAEFEVKQKQAQLELLQTLETKFPADTEEPVIPPEVSKIIDKARKEEKDKQYAIQEKFKKEAQEAKKLVEANELKIKEMEKQLEVITKSQSQPKLNKPAIAPELTGTIEELKQQIAKLNEESLRTKQEFQETLKKRDLEAYKLKKIAESKGQIIPELLVGNSESEIDASFLTAVQRYDQLQKEFQAKFEQEQQPIKTSVIPDKVPVSPLIPKLENRSVKDMSVKEYAEHRDQIFEALRRQSG